jgi:hypothetical protein
MSRLLTTAAALIALTISALPANAGDNSCVGTVVVDPEWITVEDEHAVPLPKDHPRYSPNAICRIKTNSPLGQRFLRKCPNGSYCDISLSIDNHPKDHRVEGRYNTIIKWPAGGVEKN